MTGFQLFLRICIHNKYYLQKIELCPFCRESSAVQLHQLSTYFMTVSPIFNYFNEFVSTTNNICKITSMSNQYGKLSCAIPQLFNLWQLADLCYFYESISMINIICKNYSNVSPLAKAQLNKNFSYPHSSWKFDWFLITFMNW